MRQHTKKAYDKAENAVLKQGVTFSVRSVYNSNYNNHVGNDWGISRYVNGSSVSSQGSVVLSLGGRATVKSVCIEDDSVPDVGSNSSSHTLTRSDFENGFTLQHDVTVRENRGRYSGNTAGFTFKYEFVPMSYTVVVDETNLPAVLEVPTSPEYNPPIAEKTTPVEPAAPSRPSIKDVDVPYPELDKLAITPINVYKRNTVALVCILIISAVLVAFVIPIIKKIKKITVILREERRTQQIEQERIDFYSPETLPRLPYIVHVPQTWSCEEEKRINFNYMDYLNNRNLLILAQHHQDFLANKMKSPYLIYNEGLNICLADLYNQARDNVEKASLAIEHESILLWQETMPEYDKLSKSFPFTRSPFTKKSKNKELDGFFSQSNVAFLISKTNTFVFTPYYILEYLEHELRFLLIPYSRFDVALKHGEKTLRTCPEGADLIMTTWEHMTKNGQPDRRYTNNPAVYQIFDGEIHLQINQTVIVHHATNRSRDMKFVTELRSYKNVSDRIAAEVLQSNCPIVQPIMQYEVPQFLSDEMARIM